MSSACLVQNFQNLARPSGVFPGQCSSAPFRSARSLQRLERTESPGKASGTGLPGSRSPAGTISGQRRAPPWLWVWRRARALGRRVSIPPVASRGRPSVRSTRAGAGGGAALRRAALQPGPGPGRWMPRLRSCCLPGGLRRPVSAGQSGGGEPGPGGWRGGLGPAGGARGLLLLPCPLEAAARALGSVPGGAAGLDSPGRGRSGAAGRESAGPVLAGWAPEAG